MSKIMIASDIHGSAYYCRLMLDRFKEENAERLVLLGDILYHGPKMIFLKNMLQKEVIAMLNPPAQPRCIVKKVIVIQR